MKSSGDEKKQLEEPQPPRPRTRERIPIRFHRVAKGEVPTVLFPYPQGLKLPPRADPPETIYRPKKWPRMKYLLYWERNCIKTVFNAAGLVRSKDKDPARHPANTIQGSGDWNVAWSKHFPIEQYRLLRPEQRINSFPGTGCIGRKDTLAAIMSRFDRRFPHGGAFRFLPQTFILRGHYGEMDRFLRAARKRAGHRDPQLSFTTAERRRRRGRRGSNRFGKGSNRRGRDKAKNRKRLRRRRALGSRSSSESDSDDSDSQSDTQSGSDIETEKHKDARILSEDRKRIESLRRRASMDQDRMGSRAGFAVEDDDDDWNNGRATGNEPNGLICGSVNQRIMWQGHKTVPLSRCEKIADDIPSRNILGENCKTTCVECAKVHC